MKKKKGTRLYARARHRHGGGSSTKKQGTSDVARAQKRRSAVKSKKGRRFVRTRNGHLDKEETEDDDEGYPGSGSDDEDEDDVGNVNATDVPGLLDRGVDSDSSDSESESDSDSEASRVRRKSGIPHFISQRPRTKSTKGKRVRFGPSKGNNKKTTEVLDFSSDDSLPFLRIPFDDSGVDIDSTPNVSNEVNSIEETVDNVLSFGLSKVGFGLHRQYSVRRALNDARFKAHFGVGAKTVRAIYNDLKKEYPSCELVYLLLAMNWMKMYDTEHALSGRWDFCEDHLRGKTKEYVRKVQSLKGKKIVLEGFDDDEIHWITVDCVNFETHEFRLDPSVKYFDHKSHSCGLKYEFAVALRRPNIVWMRGPLPAGEKNDGTLFRGGRKADKDDEMDKTSLYFQLPAGKKAIADSGYVGMPEKVTITRDGQSSELRKFLGRAKNRQESLHTRLKSFRILGSRFRHGKSTQNKMDLHQSCVEAVCVIVQYDMENGNPIFDV